MLVSGGSEGGGKGGLKTSVAGMRSSAGCAGTVSRGWPVGVETDAGAEVAGGAAVGAGLAGPVPVCTAGIISDFGGSAIAIADHLSVAQLN